LEEKVPSASLSSSPRKAHLLGLLDPEMKALRLFETSGIIYPTLGFTKCKLFDKLGDW